MQTVSDANSEQQNGLHTFASRLNGFYNTTKTNRRLDNAIDIERAEHEVKKNGK